MSRAKQHLRPETPYVAGSSPGQTPRQALESSAPLETADRGRASQSQLEKRAVNLSWLGATPACAS